MKYAPSHPLRVNSPYLPEHRIVLYDKIGPGTHACFDCGGSVKWGVDLYTDHADGNTANNDPSNLRPACNKCNGRNTTRAIPDSEEYVVASDGHRVRGVVRVCARCGKRFMGWPDKRQSKNRYCSKDCMYARSTPATS